jgi:uncharacterized protein (TIGR00369 family)
MAAPGHDERDDGVRARTFTWHDPDATATAAGARSGLEFLRALVDGELPAPPIARTLDLALVEVDEGRAVFAFRPQEFHYNPIGAVHGGLALTLIDSATGCAVQSLLPAGAGYTTLETKANFVRPITVDSGEVRCTAEAVHVGRSTATAQARVEDEQGRLLAHGTSTLLLFRG